MLVTGNLKKDTQIIMLAIHGLGDTIMFLPTIREVSKSFSNSKITVLVRNKVVKEMLELARLPSNVLIYNLDDSNSWRFKLTCVRTFGSLLRFNRLNFLVLKKVIGLKPSVTIAMTKLNNRLTPLMLKFSGSKITVGESHGWGRHLLTHPVETDRKAHRVLQNLSLLEALDIPQPDKPDLRLYPTQDSIRRVVSLIKSVISRPPKISFAVAPCATLGQRWRLWPCEYWAKLITLLNSEFDAACFILGGSSKQDHQIGEEISERLPNRASAYNLVGQLDIKDTIALISVMDCICGIDCGLLHIAAGVGTFIHAIWSVTQIEHYPFTDKKEIITVQCNCKENYPHNIRKECLKKPRCMEHFFPEPVFEQIARVWKTKDNMPKIAQYW